MAYYSPVEYARVALLLPRFVRTLLQLMNNFEKRTGERIAVVSGHRSDTTQETTYADSLAQGFRAAPPGKSKHPYAAADLNIMGRTSGDAATDQANPLYRVLAEEARKLGLKPGFDFTPIARNGKLLFDPYHVEDPAPIAQLKEEHAAFLRGRLWRVALVVAAAVVAWFFIHHTNNKGKQ